MKRIISLSLVTLCAALPLAVQAAPGERFQALKRIESQSHQERIQILQDADRCIQGAATPKAYKACETAEAEARKESNERARAARKAL